MFYTSIDIHQNEKKNVLLKLTNIKPLTISEVKKIQNLTKSTRVGKIT
jgi:hypothetical protein